MNHESLIALMDGVSDDLIAEAAAPQRKTLTLRRYVAFAAAAAAVLALVLGIPFWSADEGIVTAPGVFVVNAHSATNTSSSSINDFESVELKKGAVNIDSTRPYFCMTSEFCPGILLSISVPEQYGKAVTYQVIMPNVNDRVYQYHASAYTYFENSESFFSNGSAIGCELGSRGQEVEHGVWEDQYIYFVLYDGDYIIGFVVIKACYIPNTGSNKQHYSSTYTAELLDAVCFPKVNGKHQKISMDYVNQQIAALIGQE